MSLRACGSARLCVYSRMIIFIFTTTTSILKFVPTRVHISSLGKLVGLAMGMEDAVAHVTTTQTEREHSTSDLGNFGQYFTKGKATAKPK